MEVTWKERRRGYEGGGGNGDGGVTTGRIRIGERGKRRDIMEYQGQSHGSDRKNEENQKSGFANTIETSRRLSRQ
ncbi:hypothetical protein V1478_015135 [Vespula squamosa]|uniref:Uncharacterized protein n=1 Tax=Vespula squamosa TaxID=30214 RepID=A0ABD2A4M2_VESSQ